MSSKSSISAPVAALAGRVLRQAVQEDPRLSHQEAMELREVAQALEAGYCLVPPARPESKPASSKGAA